MKKRPGLAYFKNYLSFISLVKSDVNCCCIQALNDKNQILVFEIFSACQFSLIADKPHTVIIDN